MKSAALRLESFAGPAILHRPAPTEADLEHAYQSGHERGLAEGREASLDRLSARIADFAQGLGASDAAAAATRRETIHALVPVLAALIDLLAPRSRRDWLLAAIGGEMLRLAEAGDGSTLVIHCPPDLQPDIQDCAARAGIDAARLRTLPLAGDTVELSVGPGSIALDPDRTLAEIRAIIDALKED